MHTKLSETFAKYEKIIFVGGGTGGHISPIVSLTSELRETKKLLWIGGEDSQESSTAEKEGVEFHSILTLKLSTTKSPRILLYPFILLSGIFEARRILRSVIARYEAIQVPRSPHSAITPFAMTKPVAVFSKGGPGSVAVGIAAWSLKIPLYIHESDTIPGRSNALLGTFATTIFLGFESAKKYFDAKKCEVVGQILSTSFRKEVPEGQRISLGKQEKISPSPLYKEGLNWQTDKPHILVICGSQGARVVFESILTQFRDENPYEWIIALGKLNSQMKPLFDQVAGMNALDWISQEDIAHLLSGTDIAITRGSATTLAEIDAFGVRKIIIPLPESARDHQYWNAKGYEKTGDVLLEQKNLTQLIKIIQSYEQRIKKE